MVFDFTDIGSLIVVTNNYYNNDLVCMGNKFLIVVSTTLCNVITNCVATRLCSVHLEASTGPRADGVPINNQRGRG